MAEVPLAPMPAPASTAPGGGHKQPDGIDVAQALHQGPPATPSTAVQVSRWLAVVSLLALIALGLAWELAWSPIRPGGSWLALKVLPLCIPLAGLLKNRLYTYRWVSLVVWLYFIEGVVRGWGDKPPGNWLGQAEVALCLMLFAACTLHVRLRLGPRKPRSAKETHHE